MATYRADHVGFGKMMHSYDVRDLVRDHAKAAADKLRASAPVDSGEYRSRIRVQVGRDILRGDREAGFVVNTADYATALEVGTRAMPNPPRPLTKLLDQMRG
jgi:HK97 gp10 family phage protein